jgi:hypothetical protein
MSEKYFNRPRLWRARVFGRDALTLIAAIGMVWGLWAFVDWRIREVVTDQKYIQRVAAEVRPSVIFDNEGRIVADMGGLKYIETIEVLEKEMHYPGPVPTKILVRGKQFLAVPPILTSFSGVQVLPQVERGQKFDWIFNLSPGAFAGGPNVEYRFRLEIIQ